MDIPNKHSKKKKIYIYLESVENPFQEFSKKYLYMSLLAQTIQMFTKVFNVLNCVFCTKRQRAF